jgi:DNA-directed RNA polymerase specialized sigma24 family protein
LSALCTASWYPIHACVRRLGYAQEDPEDLTRGFFSRLLEKQYLRDFRRERGRLRSFLLAAAKHFIANEYDRARAKKRGGSHAPVPLDDLPILDDHPMGRLTGSRVESTLRNLRG